MQRRDFLGLIGATALSIPRPGYAQSKTDMPLVGLLVLQKPDTTAARDRITALRKGLQEEGLTEGTNYSLAVRFSEGDMRRYPQFAPQCTCHRSSRLSLWDGRVLEIFSRVAGCFCLPCRRPCRARASPELCTPGRDAHRQRDERSRWRRNDDPKAHRAFQGACP